MGAGKPGTAGNGAFHADVIGARDAAADAHAFAVPRGPIIGGAAGDGLHEIFTGERLDGLETLIRQPIIQAESKRSARTASAERLR